jgi:hypothetical protein
MPESTWASRQPDPWLRLPVNADRFHSCFGIVLVHPAKAVYEIFCAYRVGKFIDVAIGFDSFPPNVDAHVHSPDHYQPSFIFSLPKGIVLTQRNSGVSYRQEKLEVEVLGDY